MTYTYARPDKTAKLMLISIFSALLVLISYTQYQMLGVILPSALSDSWVKVIIIAFTWLAVAYLMLSSLYRSAMREKKIISIDIEC